MELNSSNTSVDMIDLTFNISIEKFNLFIKEYIEKFDYDIRLKFWESTYYKHYRYNWTWTEEDYSFYFGYSLNMSQDLSRRFRLSYNPNKVDPSDEMLLNLLRIFNWYKDRVIIQSFDIAFDYEGITTSDLIIDKGRKKVYKEFGYPDSDKTFYFGSSGKDGHIKIYDKASEENKCKSDYSKTRFEVTIKPNLDLFYVNQWKCTTAIPKMYLKGVQGLYDDKDLSPTDRLLLYSVENSFPMDKLTYRQRQKYEKIVDSRKELYTKIEPSQSEVEKVLRRFINKLFY